MSIEKSIKLDPTNLLTPSELILLNSGQFTGEKINNEDLFNVEINEGLAKSLVKVILIAGILANEEVGAIRL